MLEIRRLRARVGGLEAPELARERIGDHLLAVVVYDWPESVQSVNDHDLRRRDASFYEAMEVARANLAEATRGYGKIGDRLVAFLPGDRC